MDANKQLELFRERWKEELNRKQSTEKPGTSQISDAKPYPPITALTSSVVQSSYFDSKANGGMNEEKIEQTNAAFSQKSTSYYPFSIVDSLLNENKNTICSVNESRKRKVLDKDITYCSNVARMGGNWLKSSHGKKMKFENFKDLFSKIWGKQIEAEKEQSLLDQLIADIDEITAVPFFDISLPREIAVKIFQYLNVSDLCHCAQVSKSWRSIAEDELLWCRICHRLGQDVLYTTREKSNWKQIVQHNVERQRLLELNWKGRVGKLKQFDHHQGKILCTVNSRGDQVIAGYTSGDVKLWNLSTGDSCVYSPSSTSLMILDDDENTVRYNFVESVVLTETVAAAVYSQGYIDIWNLGADTQPIQTYKISSRNKTLPSVCLSENSSALCVTQRTHLDLMYRNNLDKEYTVVQQLTSTEEFSNIKFKDNTDLEIPPIVYCEGRAVKILNPRQANQCEDEIHVTELHNMIGASVDVIDYKGDNLGVAILSQYDLNDKYKIYLYDMATGKCNQTLHGHTLNVTCMNMLESPDGQLVTGSADRKVRVFDIRMQEPVQTLMRHSGSVTSVQMDDWKVVTAAYDGFMVLFDRRMGGQLWDFHNRHPVRYCHYQDKYLVVANVPGEKFTPQSDMFESTMQRRYRGTINVYNFLEDMSTQDVPEICLSTYEEPDASRYNISLAVPYDSLQF